MTTATVQKQCVHVFPSELGWMLALWRNGRLRQFVFGHASAAATLRALKTKTAEIKDADDAGDDPQAADLVKRMQAFARGEDVDLRPIRLDLNDLTPFQHRVVELCRRIPRGQTMTYGELARRAGRPGAARAVGNVMATNQLPLIVPCHRVVGAGGSLGGYSGPDGLHMKRRLLDWEGAALARPEKPR